MKPLRPTYAEIHLDCLEHNLNLIRKNFSSETFLCPMVKANAYGHNDVMIAAALEKWGVKQLGVCLVEEGVKLREAGLQTKIMVFKGFNEAEIETIERYGLTPVVTDGKQLEILCKRKKPVEVHVKFNTGMNRLGFEVEEAAQVAQKIQEHSWIQLKGIGTHLAEAEFSLDEGSVTDLQLHRLLQAVPHFEKWNPTIHALNSGGIICKMQAVETAHGRSLNFWGRRRNWGLRPGICIYGYNPTKFAIPDGFKPVMTLRSQIQQIRKVKKGAKVSYGGTWQAERESMLGVLPIGYADGIPRVISNGFSFLLKGKRVPQVGRVCMDFVILDLTDIFAQNIAKQDELLEVTLFGWDDAQTLLSADEVANKAGTISYEILSRVGERVPRIPKPLSQIDRRNS